MDHVLRSQVRKIGSNNGGKGEDISVRPPRFVQTYGPFTKNGHTWQVGVPVRRRAEMDTARAAAAYIMALGGAAINEVPSG